jgi:hypothetical protein
MEQLMQQLQLAMLLFLAFSDQMSRAYKVIAPGF